MGVLAGVERLWNSASAMGWPGEMPLLIGGGGKYLVRDIGELIGVVGCRGRAGGGCLVGVGSDWSLRVSGRCQCVLSGWRSFWGRGFVCCTRVELGGLAIFCRRWCLIP